MKDVKRRLLAFVLAMAMVLTTAGMTTFAEGTDLNEKTSETEAAGDTVDIHLIKGRSTNVYVDATETEIGAPTDPQVAAASVLQATATYEKSDTVESGKQYLIVWAGASRSVVLAKEEIRGSEAGLTMKAGNTEPIKGDYNSALWTLQQTEGEETYRILTTAGTYLSINGVNNITLSGEVSESTSITIDSYSEGNDGYKICKGSQALNNFGKYGNVFASAYGFAASDANFKWYFYELVGYEVKITAKQVGETDIVIGDTTYHITVEEDPDTEADTEVDVVLTEGQSKVLTVSSKSSEIVGGDSDIVSAERLSGAVNYKKVNTIESGRKYLIVNGASGTPILCQEEGQRGAGEFGVKLQKTNGVNGITGDYENLLWSVTASPTTDRPNGYALQTVEGKYLNIQGQNNVYIRESLSTVDVYAADAQKGRYYISNTTGGTEMCLNNFGGDGTVASGYGKSGTAGGGANEAWYFYQYAGWNVKFTGKQAGETDITIGKTTYHIQVKEKEEIEGEKGSGFIGITGQAKRRNITKLTISINMQYQFALREELAEGQTVEWSMEDDTVATVDQNGTVTAVSRGNTVLRAIVYDEDGAVLAVNEIPVKVFNGNGSTGLTSDDQKVDIYLQDIQNTRVYYSFDCNSDLTEVKEGEVIYASFSKEDYTALDFFAAPEDGYALNVMGSTNSQKDYRKLNDKEDPLQCDFAIQYPGSGHKGTFGEAAFRAMVMNARAKGCDGALGFTRGYNENNNPISSDLYFDSEQLLSVEKRVKGIWDANNSVYRDYRTGMVATAGETIVFEVVVTENTTEESVHYEEVLLTDHMNEEALGKVYFDDEIKGAEKDITEDFDSTDPDTTVHRYDVKYEIAETDIGTQLTNQIDLTYKYTATYSTGEMSAASQAEAAISVRTFNPIDIVVDFGQPVKLDFKERADAAGVNIVKAESNTGTATVTVEENIVTYRLDKVMQGIDSVTLTDSNDEIYTFSVYPATSVYYEEGFAAYTGAWSGEGSKGNKVQEKDILESGHLYGYTDYNGEYSKDMADSNDSCCTSETVGDMAEFTFTGTGCDIYTWTGADSGAMTVWLFDEAGKLKKMGYVDTMNQYLENPEGETLEYYNTPVFGYQGLALGTYKVVIKTVSGKISLDGFRVYNTLGDEYREIYARDKEANVQLVEVRDVAIAGSSIDISDFVEEYMYGDAAEQIVKAVYDVTNNGKGAIILQEGEVFGVDADMVNYGPKNEIYLMPGQAIAMKLEENCEKVAIGMRCLNGLKQEGDMVTGEVDYKLNETEGTVSSALDMYYEVIPDEDGNFVIMNNEPTDGTGSVLAITKLKTTSGEYPVEPLAVSISADAGTVAYALMCMADFKPEQPETPEEQPEIPAEKPTEKPEVPAEKPTEKPEVPTEKPMEEPKETPAEKPLETWTEKFSNVEAPTIGSQQKAQEPKLLASAKEEEPSVKEDTAGAVVIEDMEKTAEHHSQKDVGIPLEGITVVGISALGLAILQVLKRKGLK